MADGRYWSIEHCGWVPCPSSTDALATPWSAHGLPVPADGPTPLDGFDLLQTRPRSGRLPAARRSEDAAQEVSRPT